MGEVLRKIRFIILFLCVWIGVINISHAQQQVDNIYSGKLVEVQNMLRAGQAAEAIGLLEELIEKYPNNPEAYYAKSLIYAQGQDFNTAISAGQIANQLQPSNILYGQHLISLFKTVNDAKSAIAVLDKLIQQNPTTPPLRREKIGVLQASQQLESALTAVEEAEKAIGTSDTLDVMKAEILINLKREQEALVLLQKWYKEKSTLKEVYSLIGQVYAQQGNSKDALVVLENGLKTTKNDLIYLDLADVYRINRRERQSYDALKKAFDSKDIDYIDKHRVMSQVVNDPKVFTPVQRQELANTLVLQYPRMPDSYIFKADMMWQRNNLTEARSLYLTALGINEHYIEAWRKLMSVEFALNEIDAAIGHGHEALASNPNNPLLTYFTGLAYLIKKDNDNAREFLEAALNNSEMENDYVKSMIYSSLGDLYHQIDMKDVSDVAYEEAIRLDSTNVSALNNLAYYLSLRKKDLDKAAKYAVKANEIEPNSGTFQDTYAWILFQQGKYRDAKVWIEQAVQNSQPSAVLFEHYGDILIKLGKEKEATKQWEKALTLSDGKSVNNDKLKQKISEKKYIE